MTLIGCSREKDVRELVLRGQWPQAAGEELREHAAGCRTCSDLALVMQTFSAAKAEISAQDPVLPHLPSAGVLWWRAQLRKRKAAMEKIDRPIVGAQIFAFASVLVIALAFAAFEAKRGANWFSFDRMFKLGDLPRTVSDYFGGLWTSASSMPVWGLALGLAGLAAVAVFSGVVLYLDRQRR